MIREREMEENSHRYTQDKEKIAYLYSESLKMERLDKYPVYIL